MPTMKAVQVPRAGGDFELVERPIPEPGRGQVRIKVEACGICHSDAILKEGQWPFGLQYPCVPGHEIAGRIDAVGPDVLLWKPGQRVGVGWHGGHCFRCDPCRRGDFINCRNEQSPPSQSMVATQNIQSLAKKRLRQFPKIFRPPKPPRCSAPALPCTT